MQTFNGFDEIKQQYPSAVCFALPILYRDINGPVVRGLSGNVNAEAFEGREPTTVYFVGPEGGSHEPVARLVFVHRAEGWNTAFRKETNRWEEIRHAATGAPLYASSDFSPLAHLRIPEDAVILRFGGAKIDQEAGDDGEVATDLLANATARLDRFEAADCPVTLAVTVRNDGQVRIRDVQVWWVMENETPQPVQGVSFAATELGGSLSLIRERSFSGALMPGCSTQFLLDPRTLSILRSQVAALSPERYWIAVRSGHQEIARVSGAAAGDFLERITPQA